MSTNGKRNGNRDDKEPAMSPIIRPFTAGDYAAVVEVNNQAYPEYPDTVDEWRHWDAHRDPKMKHKRFTVEVGGAVAGYGAYNQWEGMYHPRKFGVDIVVAPELRRRGIGSRIYDHVVAELEPFDPMTLWASAREDHDDSLSFLGHRGFQEVMRNWESHLDLTEFDPSPWSHRVQGVADSGVLTTTLAELRRSDPDCYPKLYELVTAVAADVPSPDEHTNPDYAIWLEKLETSPNLLPELYYVAVDGDKYVALSNMWASQAQADELYTGLTGTRREYRRRGIALALKVACITAARDAGYSKTKTWNETGNEGMLSINVELGFKRQPAWINFGRDVA